MSAQDIRDLFSLPPLPPIGKRYRLRRGKSPHARKAGPGRRAKCAVNPPGSKLRRYFASNAS